MLVAAVTDPGVMVRTVCAIMAAQTPRWSQQLKDDYERCKLTTEAVLVAILFCIQGAAKLTQRGSPSLQIFRQLRTVARLRASLCVESREYVMTNIALRALVELWRKQPTKVDA